jgi:protein TonB
LCLLVAWPKPLAVFFSNLTEHLGGKRVPGLVTTSEPDHHFWHGVDLRTPLPHRGLLDSIFAHLALVGLLYAVSIWTQPPPHLAAPLSRSALRGYTLSEYLPELHGAQTHPQSRGKRDPVLAKQEIESLPNSPDNLRQTIVAPPKLTIKQDVELPNLVAFEAAPPVQPLSASERKTTSLRLPKLMPEVVGPAADTSSLHAHHAPVFEAQIVEPTPDLAKAKAHLVVPDFQPKVVEPAPDLGHVSRGSTAHFAHLAARVAEPIPESPRVPDARSNPAQIIALSVHPAEVHAPVPLPSGNRKGEFAVSPTGRVEASGAPGSASSTGSGANDSNLPLNAPPGISVAAAPSPAATVSAPDAPDAKASVANSSMLAAVHPAMPVPTRHPVGIESPRPLSDLENRVFSGRRAYTLSVNMPNLNAATGSWIIHFAEQKVAIAGSAEDPIAAPEVVSKFDPAYPGDLRRDGVEGTVILTAIIRADGSVGEIAVAKSLNPRLDQSAANAFSRWLFRPALKNGRAIDLEAVITVPFRAHGARLR